MKKKYLDLCNPIVSMLFYNDFVLEDMHFGTQPTRGKSSRIA